MILDGVKIGLCVFVLAILEVAATPQLTPFGGGPDLIIILVVALALGIPLGHRLIGIVGRANVRGVLVAASVAFALLVALVAVPVVLKKSEPHVSTAASAHPRQMSAHARMAEPSRPLMYIVTSFGSTCWPFWNGISTLSISGMVR